MATKKVKVKSSIRKGKVVKGYTREVRQKLLGVSTLAGLAGGAVVGNRLGSSNPLVGSLIGTIAGGIAGSTVANKLGSQILLSKQERLAIKKKNENIRAMVAKQQGYQDPTQEAIKSGINNAILGGTIAGGVSLTVSDAKSGGYLRTTVGAGQTKPAVFIEESLKKYRVQDGVALDLRNMDDKLYAKLGGKIDPQTMAKKEYEIYQRTKASPKAVSSMLGEVIDDPRKYAAENKLKKTTVVQIEDKYFNKRFANKYLGKVGIKARKAAIVGALGYGTYSAIKSYKNSKDKNEKYNRKSKFNHEFNKNVISFSNKRVRVKSSIRKGKIVKAYERNQHNPLKGLVDISAATIGTGLAYKGIKPIIDVYTTQQNELNNSNLRARKITLNSADIKGVREAEIKNNFRMQGRQKLGEYKVKLDAAKDIRQVIETDSIRANNQVTTLTNYDLNKTLSDEAKQNLLKRKVEQVAAEQGRRANVAVRLENEAANKYVKKLSQINKLNNQVTALSIAGLVGTTVGLGSVNAIRSLKRKHTKQQANYSIQDLTIFARKLGSKDKAKRKKRNVVKEGVTTVGLGGLAGIGYQRFKDVKKRKQLIRDINTQEINRTKNKYVSLVSNAEKQLTDAGISVNKPTPSTDPLTKLLNKEQRIDIEANTPKEVSQLKQLVGLRVNKEAKVLGDIGRENRRVLVNAVKQKPISKISSLGKAGVLGALGAGIAYGGYSYINHGNKKNK